MQGMERIYEIKHRQAHVPLAICVADVEDVARYGSSSHLPDGLLDALLPGAVTVILARRPDAALCPALNPGLSSIGELHRVFIGPVLQLAGLSVSPSSALLSVEERNIR